MVFGPVLTPVKDIGAFIRDQRTSAQISLRGLAAKAGVSNPYLSQVERGLRRPSADILAQIAHGLSISVETLLARAGILQTAEAPDVVLAIRADEVLSERQKSSLIDVYSAFRREAAAGELAGEPDPIPTPSSTTPSSTTPSSATPSSPSELLMLRRESRSDSSSDPVRPAPPSRPHPSPTSAGSSDQEEKTCP